MAKFFVFFEIVGTGPGGIGRIPGNDTVEFSGEPVDLDDVRAIEARLATKHNLDRRSEHVVLARWQPYAREGGLFRS